MLLVLNPVGQVAPLLEAFATIYNTVEGKPARPFNA